METVFYAQKKGQKIQNGRDSQAGEQSAVCIWIQCIFYQFKSFEQDFGCCAVGVVYECVTGDFKSQAQTLWVSTSAM